MDLTTKCLGWSYKDTDGYNMKIVARAAPAYERMLSKDSPGRESACRDTRRFHANIFFDLVPLEFSYYAGRYRGDPHHICIKSYEVHIEGDPNVGRPSHVVERDMANLATEIASAFASGLAIDTTRSIYLKDNLKLITKVAIAAEVFVAFLTIHPYADGNGHTARFMLISMLETFGLRVRRFPFHPRPDEPYASAIAAHRLGARDPLIQFLLKCL